MREELQKDAPAQEEPSSKKKSRKKLWRELFLSKEGRRAVLRIVRDARPIAPQVAITAVISLFAVLIAMVGPELVGRITDRIYLACTEGVALAWDLLLAELLALVAVYLLSAAAGIATMTLLNRVVSRHFTCRIRVEMSKKIASLPIKYVDSTPNGEIISRMTNDVSVMGNSIHSIFNIIINGMIKLAVITVVIFLENPILAATVVVFVPLSLFLSAVLAGKSEKYFDESRRAAGNLYSVTEESLTGFETVKAFHLEGQRQKKYAGVADGYREKSRKSFFLSGIVQPSVGFVNNIAYIAICVVGGILALNHLVGVGELLAFIMYTKLYSGPLESIAGGMSMMQPTAAAAKRVYEFLDGEEMEELPKQPHSRPEGKVELRGVSFSYREDAPLIEGLDLTVNAGEKIAIVGPTGGGKTTIVNLLMRFYDPTGGDILVDGKSILQMNRSDVREMFGMVLQDTVLFSGTVYDNIAYGCEGATKEEVEIAAKRAHIHGFIQSLPKGYDTVLNEETANISGGQKQLFTIARAYLANRPILILDEATSNVDTRTELIIQKTMDELMHGRTSFVIAHRLSTVENADKILVVDGGRVVETGTHTELLAKGGLYSRIYASQYDA